MKSLSCWMLGLMVVFPFECVPQSLFTGRDSSFNHRDYSGWKISDTDHSVTELELQNLLQLAKNDYNEGRVLEAIQKTQWLLLREGQLEHPELISFDIYFHTANFFSSLDRRYGLEFYKKASALIPMLNGLNPPDVFSLYTNRAGAHALLMEEDSAMFYYRKAIIAAEEDSPQAVASAHNNLGVHFLKQQQYDSAALYFNHSLSLLGKRENDIVLYCAIRDNIAELEIREGDYGEAYGTYIFNDSVYQHVGNVKKYLSNKIRLLKSMQQLQLPGIEEQIPLIDDFVDVHKKDLRPKDILQFYRLVDEYYASVGKYKQSLPFRREYLETSDSLENASADQMHGMTQLLLALQESNFGNELRARQLEAEKTKLQLRAAERTLLMALVSAIAIVTTLILYFRKRRSEMVARARIAESELKTQQMEARMVEQELALKKKDLTNVVLHNTQVYDFNQKMIDRLHYISGHKKDTEENIRSLLVELQSQNQVSDRSIALQANIESVNEAFYTALRKRFPDLTKTEAELCGYIRINLSSKDISILKNVEAGSVKMGKNRLRKKLGIQPEDDLYAFIQAIE